VVAARDARGSCVLCQAQRITLCVIGGMSKPAAAARPPRRCRTTRCPRTCSVSVSASVRRVKRAERPVHGCPVVAGFAATACRSSDAATTADARRCGWQRWWRSGGVHCWAGSSGSGGARTRMRDGSSRCSRCSRRRHRCGSIRGTSSSVHTGTRRMQQRTRGDARACAALGCEEKQAPRRYRFQRQRHKTSGWAGQARPR
jgi:hypothetical protein